MRISTKAAVASTLLFGLTFSAQAQENPLDRIVSQFISTAISVTSAELENNVQQAVGNSAHWFSVASDDEQTKGRVEITELAAVPTESSKQTPQDAERK